MNPRADLSAIMTAALEAVDPAEAVKHHLRRESHQLWIGQESWDLQDNNRLLLLAAGKAAVPMAEAAAEIVGEYLTAGIVVTKYHHATGHHLPSVLEVMESAHPVPDAAGVRGAQAMVDLLADTTAQDHVLVLLSGGASALLPLPITGVSLQQLQRTTDLLLRAGATINEINTVRKHLSQFKGGQLARSAAPAPVAAFILSDVVGDPLDVIASGPTAPDPTTFCDALNVLSRYNLADSVPLAVKTTLEAGAQGQIAETPKPRDPVFNSVINQIVGSNRLAALAAVEESRKRGYQSLLLTTFVEGEAREVAKFTAALAKSIRVHGEPLQPPACVVWGGETTVTVRGTGKGGRNQELALAAALALKGWENITLMALATDGTDGPTDAAGAIIDGKTIERARAQGWDPNQALQENNAYPILAATGDQLRTGPTGTNVNDLLILTVI